MGSRDTLCHVDSKWMWIWSLRTAALCDHPTTPHDAIWGHIRFEGVDRATCGVTRRFGFVCLSSRVFTQEDATTCLFLWVVGLSLGMLSLILWAFPVSLKLPSFCQAAAFWSSMSNSRVWLSLFFISLLGQLSIWSASLLCDFSFKE